MVSWASGLSGAGSFLSQISSGGDSKPVISGPSNQTVPLGEVATFTVSSSNTDSYQWQTDQGTGTWINVGTDSDSYARTVDGSQDTWLYRCTGTNANGSTTTGSASLTVGVALPIADALFDIPDANVGDTYSYDASQHFSGGPVDTYSLVNNLGDPYGVGGDGSTGPLGMTINAGTGAIGGTATEGTANDYAVKGENTSGFDITNIDTVTVSVATGNAPVLLGTLDIQDGIEGDIISQDVSYLLVSGGDTPDTWELVGISVGTPPTGLTVTSLGVINGTLSAETLTAGSFGITATNTSGSSNVIADDNGLTVLTSSVPSTIDTIKIRPSSVYNITGWNNVNPRLGVDEGISLLDDQGGATGATFTSLVSWLGPDNNTGIADADIYGWEQNAWEESWHRSIGLVDAFTISGLTAGDQYRLRYAGAVQYTYTTSVTVAGSSEGTLIYAPPGGLNPPPTQWVEFNGSVAVDSIAIALDGGSGWMYFSNIEVVIGDFSEQPPEIEGTFDMPSIVASQQYNVDVSGLEVVGSLGGLATNWRLVGGAPTNAVVNSSGIISGEAVEETIAGDVYGIQAFNTYGYSNILYDADGISNLPDTPVLTGTLDLPIGTIGQAYYYDASLIFDNATSYSYHGILISGLTFNTTTGELSGTPDTLDTYYNIFITAHKGVAEVDSNTSTVYVVATDGLSLKLNGIDKKGTLSNAIALTGDCNLHFTFSTTEGTARQYLLSGGDNTLGIRLESGFARLLDGTGYGKWVISHGDGFTHTLRFERRGIAPAVWSLYLNDTFVPLNDANQQAGYTAALTHTFGANGTLDPFDGIISDFVIDDLAIPANNIEWGVHSRSTVSEDSAPTGNALTFTNIVDDDWVIPPDSIGSAPTLSIPFAPPPAQTGVFYILNLYKYFGGNISSITLETGVIGNGLTYDPVQKLITGEPTVATTLTGISFTATGNGSVTTIQADLVITTGVQATFIDEVGYTLSGVASHDGILTIDAASGLGTKPQAAPKYFDTFDVYYNNGVIENLFGTLKEGDTIRFGEDSTYDRFDGDGWYSTNSGAYGQQELGYESAPAPDGFLVSAFDRPRGWPTGDGETVYTRWYYNIHEYPYIDNTASVGEISGATTLRMVISDSQMNREAVLGNVVVVLNNGSYFRTMQVLPTISDNEITISPPLPEAINAGNHIYYEAQQSRPATKFLRVWDLQPSGASNVLQGSFTWASIGAGGNNVLIDESPVPDEWALLEEYMFFPALEADKANGHCDAWINNSQWGVTGDMWNEGGPLPFQGIQPLIIGHNASAAGYWTLPGNYLKMAQMYTDTTPQRIEVADNGTDPYLSTIREVCYLTVWTDTEIVFQLNQGEHTAFTGLYIWHFDANNTPTLIGQIQ